jgi:outer membrane protein assembly factor BamA
MAKIAVFFIILPMLAHTSSASIKNAYLGVINVTVEGAERTKDGTVKSLVERCLEKEQYTSWESIDTHILGKCISNSRLFEGVQVRVHEPDIDVAIEDRWTLIPIPIAYATDRKRSIGARVIDSNFLGYGKTVGIGGAVSTDGNAFSLSYLDPSVGFSNFTIKTSINQSSNEFDQYQRNTVIYAYRKKENTVLISLGYRITPTLELAVLANYADRR